MKMFITLVNGLSYKFKLTLSLMFRNIIVENDHECKLFIAKPLI